jgi:hypothetical protein
VEVDRGHKINSLPPSFILKEVGAVNVGRAVMRAIDAIRLIVLDGTSEPQIPSPGGRVLPEIKSSLQRNPNLVIEAPPGVGKTTPTNGV